MERHKPHPATETNYHDKAHTKYIYFNITTAVKQWNKYTHTNNTWSNTKMNLMNTILIIITIIIAIIIIITKRNYWRERRILFSSKWLTEWEKYKCKIIPKMMKQKTIEEKWNIIDFHFKCHIQFMPVKHLPRLLLVWWTTYWWWWWWWWLWWWIRWNNEDTSANLYSERNLTDV